MFDSHVITLLLPVIYSLFIINVIVCSVFNVFITIFPAKSVFGKFILYSTLRFVALLGDTYSRFCIELIFIKSNEEGIGME